MLGFFSFFIGILVFCCICLFPGRLADGTLKSQNQVTKEQEVIEKEEEKCKIVVKDNELKLIIVPPIGGRPTTLNGVSFTSTP